MWFYTLPSSPNTLGLEKPLLKGLRRTLTNSSLYATGHFCLYPLFCCFQGDTDRDQWDEIGQSVSSTWVLLGSFAMFCAIWLVLTTKSLLNTTWFAYRYSINMPDQPFLHVSFWLPFESINKYLVFWYFHGD